VVDDVQQLAGAADRVGLGRGDPELLGGLLERPGVGLGTGEPALDLADVAQVADEVEEIGDQAAVQVGEVDPGAEDPPSRVAGVVDDAAAQHADLDLGVEQDESSATSRRATAAPRSTSPDA
jgi:hypothetical protein